MTARLARRLAQLRGEEDALRRAAGLLRSARGRGRPRRSRRAPRAPTPRSRGRRGGDACAADAGPRIGPPSCPGVRRSANVRDVAPWPGQLAAPSPATTLAHPVPLQLRDGANRPVVLSARGVLSARAGAPCIFSSPLRREIIWYAGPWPLVERWWSRRSPARAPPDGAGQRRGVAGGGGVESVVARWNL